MKSLSLNLLLLFLLCNTIVNSQSWNQIGAKSPSDFEHTLWGDINAQIGIIWDLKFEPEFNGVTQKRLFATGVNSGLYVSESGEGNDWNLLNTDFLSETAIGDFVINPTFGKRNDVIIGTGLYKIKFSRNYDGQFFKGKGFFHANIGNSPIIWNQIDQTFKDQNGLNIKSSLDFWNEVGSKKYVGKMLQKDDLTLVAVIIDDRSAGSVTTINSLVYKSIDGGITWEKALTMNNFIVNDIDLDPYNSSRILVSANFVNTSTNPNIFISSNFGTSWTPILPVFPVVNELTTFYKACFSRTNNNILFVCRIEPTIANLFKINLANPTIVNLYANTSYAANPGKASAFEMTNDDFFAIGSSDVAAFINHSGSPNLFKYTWIDDNVHTDIRAFAYYPMTNDFVVATDGGINKFAYNPSLSKKYSITNISGGLAIDRILKLSSYQSNKNIYGYTHWDNGPVFKHPNWLLNKFLTLNGNENNCFGIGDNQVVTAGLNGNIVHRYNFIFNDPSITIATLINAVTNNITFNGNTNRQFDASYYSLNDFNKSIILVGKVIEPQPNQSIPPVTIATGVFILPYYDVTNSSTKASSSICQKVLEPPSFFFPLNPDWFYLQPRASITNGNYIYTATNRGLNDGSTLSPSATGISLFKSIDGGLNWTQINSPIPFGGALTDLAVDPINPEQLCFSSENKLIFWNTSTNVMEDMSAFTTPSNINTITYVNSNTILAATDFGLFVFYRDNGSVVGTITPQWIDFNLLLTSGSQKLPNLRISDVEYLFKDNVVRAATMGRGAFENTMPIKCVKSAIPTILVNDLTLSLPQTSNGDIIISNISTLTIKSELKMAPGTKIIVEKGSRLLIESNGVILNLCDNTTWDGIIAFGDNTKGQSVTFQARVDIIQNGTIKNARSAIHSDGGAIINADHAIFENCYHSISFANYPNFTSVSRINESWFNCTHPIFGYPGEPQADFISLFNIKGIQIFGNTFENSIPSSVTIDNKRGKGINSIDASYILTPAYVYTGSSPLCLTPLGAKNIFRQLSIGVDMNNGSGVSNKIDAFENIFENCGEAIKINNSIGSRLFKNSIEMSCIKSGQINHTSYCGIKFNNSTDFIAEQNTIVMAAVTFCATNNFNYTGIFVKNDVINNSNPGKQSYVFSNTVIFSGSLTGPYLSAGLVAEGPNENLHIKCNNFDYALSTTSLKRGMILSGSLNSQSIIWGLVEPADNKFWGFANQNNMIDGTGLTIPIVYYYNNVTTFTNSTNVLGINTAIINQCTSKFASNSDYYCRIGGKGLIEPGEPIGPGGSGDINSPELNVIVTPNPANTSIALTLLNFTESPMYISISNNQGIDLINLQYNNYSELNSIDIQSLPEGLYNIKVINNQGEFASCHLIVLRQ